MSYSIDIKRFLAGGLSGFIEVLVTHPIDYIKIKKQEYKQLGKDFDLKTLGIRNLYTGLFPRLIGVAPMRVIFWGTQDTTKLFLENNDINTRYNFIIIGGVSSFFQTIIDNQIELYKIARITNVSNKNLIENLLKFKGFNANLLRNFGFTSCVSYLCFNNQNLNTNFEKFSYAAMGGLIGSISTQPIDYIKTQQQRSNDKRSIYKILKNTIKDDYRKLYAGSFYRSILSISSMGIGFLAYDFLIKKLL